MSETFREALQGVVDLRHQADHPLIDRWAAGEARRETVAGAIREHWYWIGRLIPAALFNICANAPEDVVEMEMENYREETDPANPHVELLLRFCEACGMTREQLAAGRGLPTTECWLDWELNISATQHWIAGVAGVHIASEAQEPRLFSKVLPALRETYKFTERELEYWWVHAEADIEHGGRAFEIHGQALRHAREAGHGAALCGRGGAAQIHVLGRHQPALRGRLPPAIAALRA